ncbi:MAG: hypothetical protein ACRDDZ_10800 [Marinifilaceae bacterium]
MRNKLLLCLLALGAGVFTFNACSTDDGGTRTGEETVTISFSVEQGDLMVSKAAIAHPEGEETDQELSEFCPEQAELDSDLHAMIKLNINGTPIEKEVPIKKDVTGKLYTQTFEVPDGLHQLIQFQVHRKVNNACQILFSTVNHTSTYKAHIPEGFHQGEQYFIVNKLRDSQTHPSADENGVEPNVTTLNLYDKPVIPVHVLCAVNMPPKEFTYALYQINMGKVHCFPFSTNVCECVADCDGIQRVMDHIGTGILTMQRQKNTGTVTNPIWVNEGDLITINFPGANGELAKICFKDDYTVDNKDEAYYFTIKFTKDNVVLDIDCDCTDVAKGDTFEMRKTVVELQEYYHEKIWNTTYKYLHLNFCDLEASETEGPAYPWGFTKLTGETGECDN